MKVIQLYINLSSNGIVAFTNEYYNALKLCSVEVKQYYCKSTENNKIATKAKLCNSVLFENTKEQLDDINSADYVFIHALPLASNDKSCIDDYYDLIKNRITSKKVLFLNAHVNGEYKSYGIDNIKNKSLLLSMDYICTFSNTLKICDTIRQVIGNAEFDRRYIHLQHAKQFDENKKKDWIPFDEKYNRCAYFGRMSTKKNLPNLIEIYKHDKDRVFDYEMRGVTAGIAAINIPDLKYKLEIVNGKLVRTGRSEYTVWVNNIWKTKNGIDVKDNMVDDYPHKHLYIFGEYALEEGLKAMSKAKFIFEGFHLKDPSWYGNNIEYVMFEIVESGTIPIFDTSIGENIYVEDDNCVKRTLKEMDLGLFLNTDCSNIDEVFSRMEKISNNKKEYDEMRNRCWKYYKKLADPKTVMESMLNNLETKKNSKNKSRLF